MFYQILGWPRSRTAWLANYLTYGNSFCFHEGIALKAQKRLRTTQEYRELFNLYAGKYQYVGDANTLALSRQKYIIPKARVVVIERNKKEVEESTYQIGYLVDIPEIVEYPYNELLRIKYDEINDNLLDIWRFCLPGVPYCKEREYLLKDLNIQVNNVADYSDINMDV